MKTTLDIRCLGLIVAALMGCSKQYNVPDVENNQSSASEPTPDQVRVLAALVEVETQPVSIEEFAGIVQSRARKNLAALPDDEREKLVACLSRFYACYSTGDFAQYKEFRIHPPYQVSEAVAAAVTNAAAEQGTPLTSDEDIIHLAWDLWNGTNKIEEVNPEHVLLECVERTDLGQELRPPSVGRLSPHRGVSTYGRAVEYVPTPTELLTEHGTLRFFRLELLVRTLPLETVPASPLVLTGYWDPTRHDWMPYSLSTPLHVGGYKTIL